MERMRDSSPGRRVAGLARAGALALTLVLAVAAAWPGMAQGQAPPAGQGAAAAPGALARYVPKQDNLFFYLEFDGLDAHQAAWKNSAAYKLLNETKLGPLIEDLAGQAMAVMQQATPPDKRARPAELIGLFKLVAKQGFAAGFWGQNPNVGGFVIVARGADRPEIVRLLEAAAPGRTDGGVPQPIAGRTLRAFDNDASWWAEKGDLVLTSRPEMVIAAIDGQSPSMADHPVRAALVKKADDLEPVAAGFFDLAALPPLPPQAVQLGLDGLKRVELRWGIQDDALLAVVRLVAPQPRRGILAMLDQPTFTVDSLPPLPAGLTGFVAMSLDLDKLYGQVIDLVQQTNPGGVEGFAQLEQAIRQRFGFDLRRDVLGQLGPRLAIYSQPIPGGAAGNPAAAILGQFAGLTIAVEARDEALARNFDKVFEAINLIIRSQQAAARRGQPDPNAGAIGFRKVEGQPPTYVLELPQGSVPPPLQLLFRPTVKLARGQLILGASGAAADRGAEAAALPADRLWKPTDKFVPMARRLPRDMVLLTVSDPRDTLPAFVEGLPILVQQMNLLFPAVRSARDARRAQCTNNLKMIGLGMHNFVAAYDTFPPPVITGKDGKRLLSWRVAILPYLDQKTLYDKFHLDEPWDSPHNKALIKEMPSVYTCPGRADVAPGTTTYRLFTGPKSLFEADRQKGVQDVTDGTVNTILAVESREAVPWTTPDSDLPFDPNAPASLYGAGSPHPGGFQALIADGSVRFLPDTIDPVLFRKLITCNGGEVVDWDAVPAPARAQPEMAGLLHVDPAKLPHADDLKPLLFPASLAITPDREGVRLVSREPIPSISSPAASGVLIALLLPAVQSAREAARRAQCTNNLKQIALAMLNYESAMGHYPRAVVGNDGQRLLSWRVAILPYIEQQALYNKFKLDEPWDSPHNKALIDEMPKTFACPSRNLPPGMTAYRGFVGKGAFFEEDQDTKIANITDGTSNTIMVAEATEAVPWTSPDSDLPFDPEAKPSLYGAGSSHPGGFNAAFADGSVRFLKNSISTMVFKALITRAGGEVVSRDAD